jgi:hypothetical protein
VAVDLLDLTYSDIDVLIGHVTLSASTSPTSTETANFITRAAARAWGALRSLGYSPSDINSSATDAEGDLYEMARQYVILKAAASWIRANENGDTEQAIQYEEEADEFLRELKNSPKKVTGVDTPGRVRTSMLDDTYVRTTKWTRGGRYGPYR